MADPDYIEMQIQHLPEVVAMIAAAMNEDEAKWAKSTFDFHFACQKNGVDSGREFYIAMVGSDIIGITGLHRYRWGPEENIWLSWFAVRPDYQGQGVGTRLFRQMCDLARQKGYRKIFIETYQHATFGKAIEFYKKQGFHAVGRIDNYLPDGSEMLVFGLDIN